MSDTVNVDALFAHEPVARLIRCRCGKTMPVGKFDEHSRQAIREVARRVIARGMRSEGSAPDGG